MHCACGGPCAVKTRLQLYALNIFCAAPAAGYFLDKPSSGGVCSVIARPAPHTSLSRTTSRDVRLSRTDTHHADRDTHTVAHSTHSSTSDERDYKRCAVAVALCVAAAARATTLTRAVAVAAARVAARGGAAVASALTVARCRAALSPSLPPAPASPRRPFAVAAAPAPPRVPSPSPPWPRSPPHSSLRSPLQMSKRLDCSGWRSGICPSSPGGSSGKHGGKRPPTRPQAAGKRSAT